MRHLYPRSFVTRKRRTLFNACAIGDENTDQHCLALQSSEGTETRDWPFLSGGPGEKR